MINNNNYIVVVYFTLFNKFNAYDIPNDESNILYYNLYSIK